MKQEHVPPTPASSLVQERAYALPPSPHRLDLRSGRPSSYSTPSRNAGTRRTPVSHSDAPNKTAEYSYASSKTSLRATHQVPHAHHGKKHLLHLNFITPASPEQEISQAFTASIRTTKHRIRRGAALVVNIGITFMRGVRVFARGVAALSLWVYKHFSLAKALPVESNQSEIREELPRLPQPNLPSVRWYDTRMVRKKEVFVYASIAGLVMLALLTASSVVELRKTQGVVLGEATAGMRSLLQAHASFSQADTGSALTSFLEAQARFSNAASALDEVRFSPLLRRIPIFQAGSNLIAIGELTSSAAEHILLALRSLDEARTSFSSPTRVIMNTSAAYRDKASFEAPAEEVMISLPLSSLQSAGRHLEEASIALARSDASMSKVGANHIPLSYRDAYASMGGVLSPARRLTARAAGALNLIAATMGAHGPRRTVLVFQNDAELRPTGGFMGSFAYLDADNGAVTSLTVPGGGFYDLKGSMTVRVDAPYPFHVFSPYWQPWNANYLYDFPSSARVISWFLEKSQGPTVDGIIAVTPTLLEEILHLTGPVVLPEYQAVLTHSNVRRALQEEVEQRYDRTLNQPKAIIGALLPVIIERIPVLLREDPAALAQTIARALDRRDVILWSAREEEQALISSAGWGAEVATDEGDYLSFVRTNIGGGKTDRVVNDAWDRVITFDNEGGAVATLSLTREHRGDPTDIFEKTHNVDYLRVFVPKGSKLLGVQGFKQPESSLLKYEDNLMMHPELASIRASEKTGAPLGVRISEEHGRTVFGGWVMTEVQETSVIKLVYRLPATVISQDGIVQTALRLPRRYHLTIQRQPGALDTPFHDTMIVPAVWGVSRVMSDGGLEKAQFTERGEMTHTIDRDVRYQVVWDD